MLGFQSHDHSTCIQTAVAAADAHCRAGGLQFTPVRRRVLEILLDDHRAKGAYDILDRLRDEGFGSQPPVAYRALDFLVAQGFAHRIERLNAFVACAHGGAEHSPAFLICRVCCAVAEAEAAPGRTAIAAAARAEGFTIERVAIEATGLCPGCAEAA